MSKFRLAITFAVMVVVVVIGGSFATSAFPLQQAGAAKPGVATAAPTLAWTQPVTFTFSDGITVRQALKFVEACGISIVYVPGLDQALNMNVGPLEAQGVNVTLALAQILGRAHLAFRVIGERAIIVSATLPAAGGVGGGVAGAATPGVGTGAGAGVRGGTSTGVSGGVTGGVPGGVISGVPGGVPVESGQATSWPADAVRVGGSVRPPARIVDVKAVYPEVARTARVQGVVICEVLIGTDGKVADARVLRSIPLLDEAALDAVRQWEFTPVLLNGNPVPVIMTMTVNFTLE
jgi:TonB family protein